MKLTPSVNTLICGSLAYDTLMSFPDCFSESILADQLHNINVCFLVPSMRKEFGGCAGNIAYNLKMLGGAPLIMATIGSDGEPYLERLAELDVSTRYITTIKKSFTAQAFITTDRKNNQITAFHPGAMSYAHQNRLTHIDHDIRLAIVAPDGREGMLQNAEDCALKGIPFIFDPGQGLPMFSREELRRFIELATYVTVNEYEAAMLSQQTGWTAAEIASRVNALIVTQSENGVRIHSTTAERLEIPGIPAERIIDPTGCGDAFRAGLIYGLTNGLDMATCGRLGNLMGSIKIAWQGPQTHSLSAREIADRFENIFGYRYAA
ncbi:MAG: carbohydrate kinase family protein [Burkholderiaceae bacterium]|jgi:adenosine kinase|nr:carbohydrate kinase family protein [Burkholderiaceae bacterium]